MTINFDGSKLIISILIVHIYQEIVFFMLPDRAILKSTNLTLTQ